jgi:hypothetical protein
VEHGCDILNLIVHLEQADVIQKHPAWWFCLAIDTD